MAWAQVYESSAWNRRVVRARAISQNVELAVEVGIRSKIDVVPRELPAGRPDIAHRNDIGATRRD